MHVRCWLLEKRVWLLQSGCCLVLLVNPLMPERNCPRPTPNSLVFFWEYFRVSDSKKINHMRSNHRHKIRFQDMVYLKLNEWRIKISKIIIKKNSAWCVKLIRKQEILLFLYRVTKCPTDAAKLTLQKWVSCWLLRTKTKPNTAEFHSCTKTADIW